MSKDDQAVDEAIKKITANAAKMQASWDAGASIDINALSAIESACGKLNHLITMATSTGEGR